MNNKVIGIFFQFVVLLFCCFFSYGFFLFLFVKVEVSSDPEVEDPLSAEVVEGSGSPKGKCKGEGLVEGSPDPPNPDEKGEGLVEGSPDPPNLDEKGEGVEDPENGLPRNGDPEVEIEGGASC